MAEAVPGLVRAGRPRSREAIIVRAGRPRSQEAIITPALIMRAGRPRSRGQIPFGRCLSFKQVHLSSGLFVSIRVHSWFVFINDQPFFLE